MVSDNELTAEGPLQSPVTIEVYRVISYTIFDCINHWSIFRRSNVQELVTKYTAIITCLSIFHMCLEFQICMNGQWERITLLVLRLVE